MINYKFVFIFCLSIFLGGALYANPVLDNISHGNVTIQQTPSSTLINQSSDRAIINWQSFNIGAGESTHFQQPQGGIALNRVNPTQGASEIYGHLTATGQIILINPAGVYFGPSAYVNVGGLIASTANISDQNFLNGIFNFEKVAGYSGSIINQGTIIAANHGLVALIGSAVSNDGMVAAHAGKVVLGSGEAFTLSFAGNELIHFAVNSRSQSRGVDHNGNPIGDGVRNTGSLIANGGSILISAKAVQGVLDNAINIGGNVQAQSFYENNGEIILSADKDSGRVRIAANMDASGSGTKGGNIFVSGNDILLEPSAMLNVSGDFGGGHINIGGNRFGAVGNFPNAKSVYAERGATLIADAILKGEGGEVIVWSDENTSFHGNISAQGGVLSGNGGFVETSGHHLNIKSAKVNLLARNAEGVTGTWLLDPADIRICSGVGCTTTTTFGSNTYGAEVSNSDLDVGDLIAALNSASVIVQTTNSGSGGLGDIKVEAPILWTTGNNLTLSAYHDIIGTASITNTSGANVILRADNSGIGSGTVNFSAGNNVNVTGPGTVNVYYNPTVFGVQDSVYSGGSTAHQYMLVHSLGSAADTLTPSLASISNNSALWGENFALSHDIDASATSTWNAGAGFLPIGDSVTPYSGKFDGLGHEIKNLTINRVLSNTGLFGETSPTASISQLGVTGNVSGGLNTGLLIGLNKGSVNSVYSVGSVISANNTVGGLIGLNDVGATVTDVYSLATVTSSAGSDVGGLVGANAGTLTNAFSIGMVTGLAQTGGLVGNNSGTIINSFWDTDSSGQATGVGAGSAIGVTGGCFSGICTNGGTQNLTSPSVYAGLWDMSNTWGIVSGKSLPYLRALFTTTPRAISGSLAAIDPITSIAYPNTNQKINLASNGTILGSAQTGANGFYYLLLRNSSIADTYPFLAYVSGSATTKGNVVSVAPPSGGSITNLPIIPNTLLVAENGVVTPIATALYTSTDPLTYNTIATRLANNPYFNDTYGLPSYRNFITNDYLVYALDGMTGSDFLYTTTAPVDITTKNGVQFQAGPNVNFGVTGNITANNGTILFNGLTQIGPTAAAYAKKVAIKTNTSGDIILNAYTFWALQQSNALSLLSANKIMIQKPILGDILLQSMGAFDPDTSTRAPGPLGIVPYIPISPPNRIGAGSSLILSAAYTNQSIVASADVVVTNFQLLQGKWFQVATSNYPLFNNINLFAATPGFGVNGNFRIGTTVIDGSGNIINTANAEFMRVYGGDGTLANPYLIFDFYGFQGINSNTTTLAGNYKLIRALGYIQNEGITLSFWNSGRGFVPIGNALTPFTGTFDASSLADPVGVYYGPPDPDTNPVAAQIMIVNPILWPTAKNVGIFGVNNGTISNLNLWGLAVSGDLNVGAIGTNNGSIINSTVIYPYALGNTNVGTIAGLNNGSIDKGVVISASIVGTNNVGGITGSNNGSIDQVLFHGYVQGSSMVGGLVGLNNGFLTNSFWDTSASAQSQPAGNQATIASVLGGCFNGVCTNGGTVNLTSKATYQSASWDFGTTWGIDPDSNHGFVLDPNSKSFPYLQTAFPNGLRTFYGITSPATANQPLFAIGFIFRPNGTLGGAASSELPTVADGSFVVVVPSRGFATNMPSAFIGGQVVDAADNQILVVTLVGGNAKGTTLGVMPDNSGGVYNLNIPISYIPGATPFSGVMTYLMAASFFAGLNPNALLASGNALDASNLFTLKFKIIGLDARDLINYQNIFSVLYGKDDQANNLNSFYSVDKDIYTAISDFEKSNPYSFDKYQVIPDGCL